MNYFYGTGGVLFILSILWVQWKLRKMRQRLAIALGCFAASLAKAEERAEAADDDLQRGYVAGMQHAWMVIMLPDVLGIPPMLPRPLRLSGEIADEELEKILGRPGKKDE